MSIQIHMFELIITYCVCVCAYMRTCEYQRMKRNSIILSFQLVLFYYDDIILFFYGVLNAHYFLSPLRPQLSFICSSSAITKAEKRMRCVQYMSIKILIFLFFSYANSQSDTFFGIPLILEYEIPFFAATCLFERNVMTRKGRIENKTTNKIIDMQSEEVRDANKYTQRQIER